MINWIVVLRKMKDGKKGCAMLVLPHANVARRNKVYNSNKIKKDTTKLNPNRNMECGCLM
jgi:hypothetical protein